MQEVEREKGENKKKKREEKQETCLLMLGK